MTSALVNAIDKKGFVELTRKPVDGPCTTEHASTAGAFVVLTSNCFLHALREEWAAARHLPTEAAYAAVRENMDRRIFDEHLPCTPDGRASPFAAAKMRDRMRGNLYPFVPLSEEQTRLAFELQLQAHNAPQPHALRTRTRPCAVHALGLRR